MPQENTVEGRPATVTSPRFQPGERMSGFVKLIINEGKNCLIEGPYGHIYWSTRGYFPEPSDMRAKKEVTFEVEIPPNPKRRPMAINIRMVVA